MNRRAAALIALGDQMLMIGAGLPAAWQKLKGNLNDPVAVDRFAVQLHTAADALVTFSTRAQEHAGDLLDGEE